MMMLKYPPFYKSNTGNSTTKISATDGLDNGSDKDSEDEINPPPPPLGSDNDDVDDEYHEFSYYQSQQQKRRRNTLPPKFRRRATIRSNADLAHSIEEFIHNLK